MLKVKNVTKKFGNIVALDDVSFEVEPGEFLFITGPSGSGKTTLLRLILREFLPDTGQILLEDYDITDLKGKEIPLLRQQIGVVFQDFKVLPFRTLRENIEVALSVIGLPKSEWEARVDRVLDLVDLSDRDKLFPAQLSGGELQRASLARALVVNPKIILADEPTGNLDWDTTDKIIDLFEKINAEGKTVLMATHHQGVINKLDKRIIELKKHQTESESEPEEEKEEKNVEKKETQEKKDEKKTKKHKKNKKKKDKSKKKKLKLKWW